MTTTFTSRFRVFGAGLFALASVAALVTAPPALAQDSGSKTVRMVVGFSPGGPVDQAARLIAERLGAMNNASYIVENRPGANAMVAANLVKNAPADGSTIFVSSSSAITMNPSLFPRTITYNPDTDFAPVASIVEMPLILVVNATDPKMESVKTLKDLVELAKKTPQGLNYGSSGTGGLVHLGIELLATRTGMKLVHVPYKGTASAQAAMLAKEVDLTLDALAVVPHIRSGTLRALAVTSNRRLEQLPDVPTVEEAGYGDYNVASWVGLLVPKATPKAVVDKLNADVAAAANSAELRPRLTAVGPILTMSAAEFQQKIKKETSDLLQVIKASNISVD